MFAAALAAGFLILIGSQSGCGGYGNNSSTPVSGLQERAFIANQNTGTLLITDASKDQFTASSVALGGSAPTFMVPGPNNTTLVFNTSDNGVSTIDNIKEALIAKIGATDCTTASCEIGLPAASESIAESTDGKFFYAATPTTSQITFVDLTTTPLTPKSVPSPAGNCDATVKKNCLPGAHRIVLSHNNAKLLVFNETLANQIEIVAATDNPVTLNSITTVTSPSFDHPINAVFSSDDSKAYVLNCGAECGGTQASVAVLDMTSLAVTQTVNVDAATVAASDTTNLYIAGSNPATPGTGSATILPIASLSGAKQVKIGDGFHQVASVFQNKFIVGARTCTTGCLSIVDIAGATAIIGTPKGDVTAIAPITPRSVFYDAEGGEVRVYDVSNGSEHLNNNTPVMDVVGKVSSVLYVGPKT